MIEPSAQPISIIIPARNEQAFLPHCLDAIAAASKHVLNPIEIIVIINRCTDATESIAAQRGCKLVRDDTKNLSHIRNSGIRAASGDWIITIDADSRMSEKMLLHVTQALSRACVVGGGVLLIPERLSLGIILTGLCLVPIILRHGISGGLFFFRKADFEAINGFNEELSSAEDIDFAKRLKCHGKSSRRRFITLYRSHIITSCRKLDRLGDWYFLKRPDLFVTLLGGRNQAEADNFWYDFER